MKAVDEDNKPYFRSPFQSPTACSQQDCASKSCKPPPSELLLHCSQSARESSQEPDGQAFLDAKDIQHFGSSRVWTRRGTLVSPECKWPKAALRPRVRASELHPSELPEEEQRCLKNSGSTRGKASSLVNVKMLFGKEMGEMRMCQRCEEMGTAHAARKGSWLCRRCSVRAREEEKEGQHRRKPIEQEGEQKRLGWRRKLEELF